MSQDPGEAEPLAEGTLISHLLELRTRLLRSLVAAAIVFLPLAFFQNELFTLVARPLLDKLPEGTSLIATSVVAPFMAPLKLSIVAALFIAMPYVLYQIWAFVAPGLYRHERRFAMPLFLSSVVLFYVGVAFAYYVVFPLMFAFLTSTTPDGVQMMTDISSYLDFVLLLFFAFGVAFEVPVAVVLLAVDRARQGRVAEEASWLRAARHLHRGGHPHPAGRRIAELHGDSDVRALRARHPVRPVPRPAARRRQGPARGGASG